MPVKPGLKVTVLRRGGQDHDALVEHVVRAVVAEIVSVRLANTLRITVECRATKLRAGVAGFACYDVQPDPRMKEYRIIVDRDAEPRDMAETLAHEVRHVEQYARGRLRCGSKSGKPGSFWRAGEGEGVFYPKVDSTDPQQYAAYRALPYEVEARATEVLGTKAFIAYVKAQGSITFARRISA